MNHRLTLRAMHGLAEALALQGDFGPAEVGGPEHGRSTVGGFDPLKGTTGRLFDQLTATKMTKV